MNQGGSNKVGDEQTRLEYTSEEMLKFTDAWDMGIGKLILRCSSEIQVKF